MSILIFPGQGSKSGLININNPVVRYYVKRSAEVLGYDILSLTPEQSQDTKYSQPDLLVRGVILSELFKASNKEISFVAGHSLGQYAACVAAGGLAFEDALKLVVQRADFMSEATKKRPGAMMACIGPDVVETIRPIVEGFTDVYLANYNSSQQVVVSGSIEQVNQMMTECKALGVRCVKLPVSGAFHSPFMSDANKSMNHLLLHAVFDNPQAGFISNKSGKVLTTKIELQDEFMDQIVSPVLWTTISETIQALVEQERLEVYEAGHGVTLGKLLQQQVGVKATSVEDLF